jgi:hypothetical protein
MGGILSSWSRFATGKKPMRSFVSILKKFVKENGKNG